MSLRKTLASLLMAPALLAQGDAKVTPEVATLLDSVAQHRGFVERLKVKSLGLSGTYAVTFEGQKEPVAKGDFGEHFLDRDARAISTMGEFGTMEKGVSGDVVWEVDPAMGAKVHGGVAADAMRRYFAFLRGVDPRSLYGKIEATGKQQLDGRECTVVRLLLDGAKPDTWYVDAAANVVGLDTFLPAPESATATFGVDDLMPTQMRFTDFREVAGGRYPHQRVMTMGPATVTSTATRVVAGIEMERDKFAPPKAVAGMKPPVETPAFGPDGKPVHRLVEREVQLVASIRVKVKPAEISQQLAILLPEVMAHLQEVGASMAGAPFSRYHAVSDGEIDLEAGIPVAKAFAAKGRVQNSELPAGKAVMAWHVGPYDKLSVAHGLLRDHATAQKWKTRGGPWEIYWTDPGMVPDPARWKTQLFLPIE